MPSVEKCHIARRCVGTIVALPGAHSEVMDLPSMARVTKLPSGFFSLLFGVNYDVASKEAVSMVLADEFKILAGLRSWIETAGQ